MPVAASDIKLFLSGGAANTDPNASIGGAISSTQFTDSTKNNIFDDVTPAEATAGDTEYRCVYVKNTHGTIALQDARAYIAQATTSADDEVDIGVANAAVNTTETAVANENTAPASVTFSRPTTYAGGVVINSTTGLTAGSYRGLWIRRTVNAAAAAASDQFQVKVEGTTA